MGAGSDDQDMPQAIDLDHDDDEAETMPCPACGRSVHEDAAGCPYCGEWFEDSRSAAADRVRGWFWPVTVAVLIGMIVVLWHGLGR